LKRRRHLTGSNELPLGLEFGLLTERTNSPLYRRAETPTPQKETEMQDIKFIVEKHPDGYVAYPLGVVGVVVGEGDTYAEALADAQSALRFHIETFGSVGLEVSTKVLEV
jgi:predicted RNase H-like HicB family nuclease